MQAGGSERFLDQLPKKTRAHVVYSIPPTALGPIIQFQLYVIQRCRNINSFFYMKNVEEILLIFPVVTYTCTIKKQGFTQKRE